MDSNQRFVLEMALKEIRKAVRADRKDMIYESRHFYLGMLMMYRATYEYNSEEYNFATSLIEEMLECFPMVTKFDQDAWEAEKRISEEMEIFRAKLDSQERES